MAFCPLFSFGEPFAPGRFGNGRHFFLGFLHRGNRLLFLQSPIPGCVPVVVAGLEAKIQKVPKFPAGNGGNVRFFP